MEQLYFPYRETSEPVSEIVGGGRGPLKWLRVERVRLGRDVATAREHTFDAGPREYVLDIFAGRCTVGIRAGALSATFPEIGERDSVFAGRPTMVYIPTGAQVSIYAESDDFDGVLMSAPGGTAYPPVLVCPQECVAKSVGRDNWQRSVVTAIGENVRANRLLVGETTNPPGNWSSAPPHKHDRIAGDERPMEEVYVFRTDPPQGFGLQRVYTAPGDPRPFDLTYAVKDGDAVALPRGYHPVVAAPGYRLFYLWALAGEERRYGAWSDDPAHAWIKEGR